MSWWSLACIVALGMGLALTCRGETFATRNDCAVSHDPEEGVELSDGSLMLVGAAFPSGDQQALAIHVAADGRFLDGAVLSPPLDARFHAIARAADGSVVMAGSWWPRLLVMRAEADLTPRWQVAIGHSLTLARRVLALADGTFLVLGIQNDPVDLGGQHVFALRLDEDGVVIWQNRLVMGEGSAVSDVMQLADESLLLLCYVSPAGGGARITVLLRLDLDGNVMTTRALSDTAGADLQATDMEMLDDRLVVVGERDPPGEPQRSFLASLSLELDVQWALDYYTGSSPAFGSIHRTGCDTLLITGYTSNATNGLGPYVAHADLDGYLLEEWAYSDSFRLGSFSFNRPFAVTGGLAVPLASAPTGMPLESQVLRVTPSGELGSDCVTWVPRSPTESGIAVSTQSAVVDVRPEASLPESIDQPWTAITCTTSDRCRDADPAWGVRPGEIAGLRWLSKTRLSWEAGTRTCSTSFDVYRTSIRRLPQGDYGACLGTVPTEHIDDAQLPGLLSGYAYLVSGRSAGGQGRLGLDSRRLERFPSTACP